MTSKPVENQEQRQAGMAPETHNDEQDDHLSQAQEISEEAQGLTPNSESPTESLKQKADGDVSGDSTQDLVDHMRDMESSGRIDMDAYRGEPNYDDDVDKYGKQAKPEEPR
ncbi:hypothetical protein GRI39_12785 [Altererythrobacter indicus]|uniref:Uncharacterized protein n=1 Tax=Altericroceibacterium indicum TaxID=374177 RepID=A0A845ABZ3_9SPHN|nr:hypothetical protein [Altericroceibacterium indicum]MXP26909.1 hypothetical protein [Altericroceibacterium indicum]